jgi:hypothetical protein
LQQIIEEPPAEEERRSRDHINQILRLDLDAENDKLRENVAQNILKDVKKLVENSVRSLENIFKYNDVSNRNFGGLCSTTAATTLFPIVKC